MRLRRHVYIVCSICSSIVYILEMLQIMLIYTCYYLKFVFKGKKGFCLQTLITKNNNILDGLRNVQISVKAILHFFVNLLDLLVFQSTHC